MSLRRMISLVIATVLLAGCSSPGPVEPGGSGPVPEGKVRITFFGHAMFLCEDATQSVVVDPYGPDIGYIVPEISARVVLVSQKGSEHGNVKLVKGRPRVIDGIGEHYAGGFRVTGIPGTSASGGKRQANANTIYYWRMGGVSIAHMGNFGERALTRQQLGLLAGVDVLMMPVGGGAAVTPEKAAELTKLIGPNIVIPMHYKTRDVVLELDRVEGFTSRFSKIRRTSDSVLVSAEDLPSRTEVWAMNYRRQ
ncbi:MAG: hypothetical protein C4521_05245 [Actinobacteria bacterium]|nr:MAG: hypothetical protein C4521_05245 [Actinomycetota bacterium]